jgi:hypothetical protein
MRMTGKTQGSPPEPPTPIRSVHFDNGETARDIPAWTTLHDVELYAAVIDASRAVWGARLSATRAMRALMERHPEYTTTGALLMGLFAADEEEIEQLVAMLV